MSRYRVPKQRKCIHCGRVGTRRFRDDACSNRPACVQRLCDKLFLDKPKKPFGDFVFLGTMQGDVKFYGAQGPADPDPTIMSVQGNHTYTFQLDEANFGVLQAIMGAP